MRKYRNPDSILSLTLVSIIAGYAAIQLILAPLFTGAYIDYLGFQEETAGWIMSAYLIGNTISMLVISIRVQRWQLKYIVAFGLILMAVADILAPHAGNLSLFSLNRLVSGIGSGAVAAAIFVAIARLEVPDRGYGVYMGVLYIMIFIGGLFLPMTFANIGYANYARGSSFMAILCLFLVPVLDNYKQVQENQEGVIVVTTLFSPKALLAIASFAIFAIGNGGLWVYTERLGVAVGFDAESIGLIFAGNAFTGFIGSMVVVWLEDRLGHLVSISCGIGVSVLSIGLLLYAAEWAYIAGILVFSVGYSFTMAYFLSILAAQDHTGTVILGGNIMNSVGLAIGPAFAAMLFSLDHSYIPIIWMTIITFVISLVLIIVSLQYSSGKSKIVELA